MTLTDRINFGKYLIRITYRKTLNGTVITVAGLENPEL